jgi:hypothetical protein
MNENIKRYKISLIFLGAFIFFMFTYIIVERLRDYDCKDFHSQPEAQAFFKSRADVYNLDNDGDGVACENLKPNYLK